MQKQTKTKLPVGQKLTQAGRKSGTGTKNSISQAFFLNV
jgi:hypothetical protein